LGAEVDALLSQADGELGKGDFGGLEAVVLAVLVDGGVGQVDVEVALGLLVKFVLRGCEPRKALRLDLGFKRVEARDEHLNAQVELLPVDQQRLSDLALQHRFFLLQQDFLVVVSLVGARSRVRSELDLSFELLLDGLKFPFILDQLDADAAGGLDWFVDPKRVVLPE